MVGNNTNRWTQEQFDLMAQLRSFGVPWDEVAIEVGHSVGSCQQTASRQKNARLRKELRTAADLVAAIEPRAAPKRKSGPQPLRRPIPPRKAIETDCVRSSITTAKLIVDAELRGRIEVLGLTGGLFGDPLPGRSALDQRNITCGGGNAGSTSLTGRR